MNCGLAMATTPAHEMQTAVEMSIPRPAHGQRDELSISSSAIAGRSAWNSLVLCGAIAAWASLAGSACSDRDGDSIGGGGEAGSFAGAGTSGSAAGGAGGANAGETG